MSSPAQAAIRGGAPDANSWGWLVHQLATQFYPRPDPIAVHDAALQALTPTDAAAKAAFVACAGAVRKAKAPDGNSQRAIDAATFACRERAGTTDWAASANALLRAFSPYAAYHTAAEFAELVATSEADVAAKAPEAAMQDGVLVLTISQFDSETASRTARLLSNQDPGAWRATLIDVRGNKGGLLEAITAVADLFAERGPLFAIRGNQRWDIQRLASTAGDASKGRPITILIDKNSENGAELLSASLQQQGRAAIVGEASAGRVMIRTLLPMPDGGVVIMPTSGVEWPDGSPLTGPVQPDIVLTGSQDQWLDLAAAHARAQAASRRER